MLPVPAEGELLGPDPGEQLPRLAAGPGVVLQQFGAVRPRRPGGAEGPLEGAAPPGQGAPGGAGLRRGPLGYLLKLAFFNAAFTLIYLTMAGAVASSLPEVLGRSVWVLYGAAHVVFLLYDYGFSRLIAVYIARVQRAAHGKAGT